MSKVLKNVYTPQIDSFIITKRLIMQLLLAILQAPKFSLAWVDELFVEFPKVGPKQLKQVLSTIWHQWSELKDVAWKATVLIPIYKKVMPQIRKTVGPKKHYCMRKTDLAQPLRVVLGLNVPTTPHNWANSSTLARKQMVWDISTLQKGFELLQFSTIALDMTLKNKIFYWKLFGA